MLIPIKLRKLLRFVGVYGPGRTLFKVAGRLRFRVPAWWRPSHAKDIKHMVTCWR